MMLLLTLEEYYRVRDASKDGSICLVQQYLSLLLVVFLECDLTEALSEVIQDTNKHVAARATVLVSELQDLCSALLPPRYMNRINALTDLFAVATTFEDEQRRQDANRAIVQLDSLKNNCVSPINPFTRSTD
jgi:hypothetical protein